MIVELGHYALVLALFVALFQAVVPLVGAGRGDMRWMNAAGPAALVQFLLVAASYGALTWAYVVSDFSVLNVAENSHSTKPLFYKISGVWANHEGSLLLWVLILAAFGWAVAAFGRNLRTGLRARVLAVQAMIAVGFAAFILFTSNPFLRVGRPPLDGNDLNPLLQDIGLVLHPPFLYLGYVGFSIAFSFAIAALLEGRVDAAWARWVRPWTLAAWVFLTAGIALGSWWAYYELGWGGWWYWDPVENASFMPWLAGTALLHSAIVVEKRETLKSWTILLAIVAFSLSLLGTFLVRSGVLTSVHAFATDPARGTFILLLLVATIGASLTLFAQRAQALGGGGLFAPVSREGGLVLNNVIMSAAAATVLLGTLYPLFVDVLGIGKISVGPPFFNASFVPMMVPLVLVMAVGPLLAWKRGDLTGALQRLTVAAVGALVAALAGIWISADADAVWAALGLGLATWLGLGTLVDLAERIRLFRAPAGETLRRLARLPGGTWGMLTAHFGVAVVILGITGASLWQVETITTMRVGDGVTVADYRFTLDAVRDGSGPNYTTTQATFTVTRDGATVAVLEPEKRVYTVRGQPTSEAAIQSHLAGDLYAVLGDPDEKGGWTVRLYWKPLVGMLWLGSVLLGLGGLLSLADRRFRVGAPVRSVASAAARRA